PRGDGRRAGRLGAALGERLERDGARGALVSSAGAHLEARDDPGVDAREARGRAVGELEVLHGEGLTLGTEEADDDGAPRAPGREALEGGTRDAEAADLLVVLHLVSEPRRARAPDGLAQLGGRAGVLGGLRGCCESCCGDRDEGECPTDSAGARSDLGASTPAPSGN